jgi:hypothetical protein
VASRVVLSSIVLVSLLVRRRRDKDINMDVEKTKCESINGIKLSEDAV